MGVAAERTHETMEEEMTMLREKMAVLEKENLRMKEEMRCLAALNPTSSVATTTTSMELDDSGGGQVDGHPFD